MIRLKTNNTCSGRLSGIETCVDYATVSHSVSLSSHGVAEIVKTNTFGPQIFSFFCCISRLCRKDSKQLLMRQPISVTNHLSPRWGRKCINQQVSKIQDSLQQHTGKQFCGRLSLFPTAGKYD